MLRTVNQDQARKKVVEDIKDDEVLIERDWAMKFIPMQYRESQSSWFGKRGINWHITVATYLVEMVLTSHTIIHIFDTATQDAETSNAILSDCFNILYQIKPVLKHAFIRSDNAGCFHSSASICAAPYLSDRIRCSRMDFADPQGGKSICDRKAAHTKSFIRRYVNEGNNVCTASEFKDAVVKMKMKNVSVVVALPPTKENKGKPSSVFKLPKITLLNNFSFTQEGFVRVWRQYDVGEGSLIVATGSSSVDDLPKLTVLDSYVNRQHIIEAERNHAIETNTHSTLDSNDNVTRQDDEPTEDESDEMSRLFTCNECTKTYSKYGNLCRHLDNGIHIKKSSIICLADKSKMEYVNQMDKVNVLVTQLPSCSSGSSRSHISSGWGLKARREVKRFNKNQTAFLDDKFDKGEKTGQKSDPEEVSQEMRQVKTRNGTRRFSFAEFLSAQQIASYFSRLVLKKRQSYNPKLTEEDLQAEIDATNFQELNATAV